MALPKVTIALLTLGASVAAGGVSVGMAVGSSKDKLDQHTADIQELKADVKEIRQALDRVEGVLGSKR